MTSDVGHRDGPAGAIGTTMLQTAVELRWRRPRLTADLAHQVAADATAAGERGLWLQAAGWYLHGCAATEDAREAAVEVLSSLDAQGGAENLGSAEAVRLRIELAAVAQANGDLEAARELVPAAAFRDDPELELDRVAVLLRCALAGSGGDPAELRREVEALAGRLRGEPAALAELLVGSVHRADGDQKTAAFHALRGLAVLGWEPGAPGTSPASAHLGSALLSQWLTALLDGGSAEEVSAAVAAVADLPEQPDTGRQGVLLRLTLARAVPESVARTAQALGDVADTAARVGAPSVEAACRGTQAELHESNGQYREALAALRAGVAAERADQESGRRFRAVLGRVLGRPSVLQIEAGPRRDDAERTAHARSTPGRRRPGHGASDGRSIEAGATAAGSSPYEPTRAAGRADSGRAPARDLIRRVLDRRADHGAGDPSRAADAVDDRPDGEHPVGAQVVPLRRAAAPSGSGEGERAGGHLLEWAERSWYGPGRLESDDSAADSGAPLADALVEELRKRSGRGELEAVAPGAEPDTAVAEPDTARAGEPSPDAERDAAVPDPPTRQEPWDAMLSRTEPFVPLPPAESRANDRTRLRAVDAAPADETEDEAPEASPDRSVPEDRGRRRDGVLGAVPDVPSSSGVGEPSVPHTEPARFVVVLDMVHENRPVTGDPAVLRDVADRAERLVPPRGEVRAPVPGTDGADDDRGAAGRVQVVLPDADRVTALLWAQSLIGHLAGRVFRGGLPEGTVLRSRVHGPDGPVGDAVRVLSGPVADAGPAPGPSGSIGALVADGWSAGTRDGDGALNGRAALDAGASNGASVNGRRHADREIAESAGSESEDVLGGGSTPHDLSAPEADEVDGHAADGSLGSEPVGGEPERGPLDGEWVGSGSVAGDLLGGAPLHDGLPGGAPLGDGVLGGAPLDDGPLGGTPLADSLLAGSPAEGSPAEGSPADGSPGGSPTDGGPADDERSDDDLADRGSADDSSGALRSFPGPDDVAGAETDQAQGGGPAIDGPDPGARRGGEDGDSWSDGAVPVDSGGASRVDGAEVGGSELPLAEGSGRRHRRGDASWVAGLTVEPGSGGRRRRDAVPSESGWSDGHAHGEPEPGPQRTGDDGAVLETPATLDADQDPAGQIDGGAPSTGTDATNDAGASERGTGTSPVESGASVSDTEASGIDAEPPGIDAEPPGIDAEPPGIDAESPGIDAEARGGGSEAEVDTDVSAVDTEEPGGDTGTPEVDTGTPAVDIAASEDSTGASEDGTGADTDVDAERFRTRAATSRGTGRRRRPAPGRDRSEVGFSDPDGSATRPDPTAIPDDLGLGDLLAGALAAYRDI